MVASAHGICLAASSSKIACLSWICFLSVYWVDAFCKHLGSVFCDASKHRADFAEKGYFAIFVAITLITDCQLLLYDVTSVSNVMRDLFVSSAIQHQLAKMCPKTKTFPRHDVFNRYVVLPKPLPLARASIALHSSSKVGRVSSKC